MRAVFLDRDSLDQGDLDLSPLTDALPDWTFHGDTPADLITERSTSAEILVVNKVVLSREILARLPRLRFIAVAATGTNNVDLAAAAERGIVVSNVRGYAGPSVVQHVFALLLSLTTRLNDYQAAVRQGRWQQAKQFCLLDYPIRELHGGRLGIVGYGELGQAVALTAEAAFGMEILVAEQPNRPPRRGRLALRELLPQVDVLSLHCPLTPETRGLIGAAELALLPPHALLINTARGGIVDEQALADALRAGKLGGAGVDVLTTEPPRQGNPLLAPDIPNLIVTPHIAWASREARQRLVNILGENVAAFLAGQPRNRVI